MVGGTSRRYSPVDEAGYGYEVGYVKAGDDGALNINASGSLTMVVQSTATDAANTRKWTVSKTRRFIWKSC